ncbi:hypothetical protein [Mycobacterium sp. 1423905.2]|uniref:hypothetical protein n=1 Tax=Mycobacterium sp. 1423905.2 TaxID=1856859 RepID=UPI0012EAD6B0|nr:hypothetical protein [Mycobacterium sp. 1423905.2]
MLNGRARTVVALLLGAALACSACGGAQAGSNADIVRIPADFCSLLSAADISQATGTEYPALRRLKTGLGEQSCESSPQGHVAVDANLFWGYCVDGKPPNMDCLNSVNRAFATDKQQATRPVAPISGLGDQAFCLPAPFATVEALKRWYYVTVVADTCPHAEQLARSLVTRLT